MTDQDLASLASEAFFYGYPLVADVDEVIRFTRTGMGSVPVPDGFIQIPAPTHVASILGRWACSGPRDLPAVHAVQDQLSLRPTGSKMAGTGVPEPADVPEGLEFFEKLRTWMAAFPPARPDRDYQQHPGRPASRRDRAG